MFTWDLFSVALFGITFQGILIILNEQNLHQKTLLDLGKGVLYFCLFYNLDELILFEIKYFLFVVDSLYNSLSNCSS